MAQRHRIRKILGVALALLLLSWLAPTYVRVRSWEQDIVAALAEGLGRPVRIGPAHLKLWGGPGFEIENVVVEEDPRFGFEPFARMELLRATVAARSLWRGQIEFANLEFVRPSFNVVRNREEHWNLESLGRPAGRSLVDGSESSAARKSLRALPKIRVDSGRVNFKSQDHKTVYAIESLDMELLPPSGTDQPWKLLWSGTPTRTDSSLRSVSQFTGRVEFGPWSAGIQQETGWPIRMDLRAEDALLGDLLRVFAGKDFGVHGLLDLQFHLAGTTSLLRVSGSATLQDLHRWDLLPPAAPLVLRANLSGLLDLPMQSLQLTSLSIPLAEGSAAVQGRIENLFHHPRPELQVKLSRASLSTLVSLVKPFTTRLDTRFLAEGFLDGNLQMADSLSQLAGSLRLSQGVLQEKGTKEALRLSDFPISLEGKKGRLGPVKVSLGGGDQLKGSFEWDLGKRLTRLRLSGEAIPLVPFLRWAGTFGSQWGQLPFTKGRAALQLDLTPTSESAPLLRGWAQISGAELHPASLNQPIQLRSARLQFRNRSVKVRELAAHIGPLELRGTLQASLSHSTAPGSVSAKSLTTVEFDGQASEIDLGYLSQLFANNRRWRLFFGSRDVGSSDRQWWKALNAHGNLKAERLRYAGMESENVQAHLQLRDGTLEVSQLTGQMAGGTLHGQASLYFAGETPSMALRVQYSGVDLKKLVKPVPSWSDLFSGKLSGSLRLSSQGNTRQEIWEHLSGSGEATGRNITLRGWNLAASPESKPGPAPTTQIHSLAATFQIARQEILLQDFHMVPAPELSLATGPPNEMPSWTGSGTIGFDQELDLVVQEKPTGQKPAGPQYHWAGTLTKPRGTVSLSWAGTPPATPNTTRPPN